MDRGARLGGAAAAGSGVGATGAGCGWQAPIQKITRSNCIKYPQPLPSAPPLPRAHLARAARQPLPTVQPRIEARCGGSAVGGCVNSTLDTVGRSSCPSSVSRTIVASSASNLAVIAAGVLYAGVVSTLASTRRLSAGPTADKTVERASANIDAACDNDAVVSAA